MFASLTVIPLDSDISTLFLTANYNNIDVGSSRLFQNNEEIRARPVSYTHLDVYKRQQVVLAGI